METGSGVDPDSDPDFDGCGSAVTAVTTGSLRIPAAA